MSATCTGLSSGEENRTLARAGWLAAALFAGFVLVFATTSSASAQEQVGFHLAGEESEEAEQQPRFEAEQYTTHLLGESTSTHKYTFAAESWVSCPWAEFFGEISEPTSELHFSQFYPFWACSASNGGAVTIKWNGCEHVLTVSNAGPPYVGKFGIDCPSEDPYQFTAGNCTVNIPDQSARAEVSYENTGSGSERSVEVTLNVSGLEHSFSCLPGMTFENGTYTGSFVLEGYNEP